MTSTIPLGELVTIRGGGTPSRTVQDYWNGSIRWATVKDFKSMELGETQESITPAGVRESATNIIPAGSVIIPTRMAVGKAAINTIDMAINQDLKALLPTGEVDTRFLLHFMLSHGEYLEGQAQGATVKGIKLDLLRSLPFPRIPRTEQRRIAAILDKADGIRRKREQALSLADDFLQSVFLEMFGDPAENPHGFPVEPLVNITSKFSDGPFGSNLKSEHYTDGGIRVVRLQNIGVGAFVDRDRAFISEDHFKSLKKHECIPGDVLVGTLGDPNLRACLLPSSIGTALNKADCVQIRPKNGRSTAEFICGLLNQPSTEHMAQSLILGQTRSRISMGRLKTLEVPIPPFDLQRRYSGVVGNAVACKDRLNAAVAMSNDLFDSLSQRAFAGDL